MSPTTLNLRHYNTPVVEGIVQPSSNTGYQMDRLPYHKYHHRDGYRKRNSSKFAEGDCCGRHHNRCGHVRREEFRLGTTPSSKAGEGRTNYPPLFHYCLGG